MEEGFFMEQMNAKELSDPNVYPDDYILKNILGDSYTAYCELLDLFKRYEMSPEWRFYQDGKAWLC